MNALCYPQGECAQWIHTANILIEDLKCLDPNYVPVVAATPMSGDAKSETATTTPAPTPQVPDGAEVSHNMHLLTLVLYSAHDTAF